MSNAATVMNTKDLQVFLDNELTSFKKADWIGSLPIQCIVIDNEEEDIEGKVSGTVDICQYIPGGIHHNEIDTSVTKLRFDVSAFPPSELDATAFKSTNQTYIKLREELQRAAIQCGYTIIPKSGDRFVCKCARTYTSASNGKFRAAAILKSTTLDKATIDSDKENVPLDPFRKQTWQNDSRNSRPRGSEPLRRKTTTSLPTELGDTCKFAVKLYHDNKGYYISTKFGNALHSNHQSIEPTNNCYNLKLLPENVKEELKKLSNAKLGAAHGRNYIFANETNVFLSRSQIRYAFRHATAASMGVTIPDLKKGGDGLI